MKVTNLIRNIGKCRDIIATKDVKTVLSNIYIFEKTYMEAKVQIDKYIKKQDYELDFTYHDLKELSDEIYAFVRNYQQKLTYESQWKRLSKHKKIDNNVLDSYLKETCNIMLIDARLREAYKIFAYLAVVVWVWKENKKNDDFDKVAIKTIQSFL